MEAYRTETIVEEDGKLTLDALPFHAGERVEVIVLAAAQRANLPNPYPLHGTPYRYDDPTEPVAQGDWEALA